MKLARFRWRLEPGQQQRLAARALAWLLGLLTVCAVGHEQIESLLALGDEVVQWRSRVQEQQGVLATPGLAPSQAEGADWPDGAESVTVWPWLQQQMQSHALQLQMLKLDPVNTQGGLPEQAVALRLQGRWSDWVHLEQALDAHTPWWVVERWQVVPSDPVAGTVRIELQARLGLRPPGWRGASSQAPVWTTALPSGDPAMRVTDPFAMTAAPSRLAESRQQPAARPLDPRQWPVHEWRLLGVWQQAGKTHAVLGAPAGHLSVTAGQRLGPEGHRVLSVGNDGVRLQAAGTAESELHWALQGDKR